MKEPVTSETAHIDFLTARERADTYTIEGYVVSQTPLEDASITVHAGHHQVTATPKDRADIETDPSLFYRGFEAELVVRDRQALSIKVDGTPQKLHTGQFSFLSPLVLAYRFEPRHNVLMQKRRRAITVRRATKGRFLAYEALFWLRLLVHWRLPNAVAAVKEAFSASQPRSLKKRVFQLLKPGLIIAESIAGLPMAYALRFITFSARSRSHQPIWIISDRGMAAGDNGEALFRYINTLETVPAKVYFALSRKSKDYQRLFDEFGDRVLDQDSFAYKKLFLRAEKIISSHADIEVTNPFLRQRYHYQDLMNAQFVFLQHGIIRHDHSSWLNRYQKNIALFITSAQKEYDSILHYQYGYHKNQVALTGLPRFDYLTSAPKGKIILAPTYRRELAQLPTNKNGARPYDPTFKTSQYFARYSKLLQDETLLELLKKHRMTLEFYLHPNLQAQAKDFTESDRVTIAQYPYDYAQAFRDGTILVTDYSSVSFDFAYLKKPLIYYQFDRATFFDHSLAAQADFFSDEDDGFGPVVTEHDELIRVLGAMMQTGRIDDQYRRRIDDFFYKIDRHNSARVYDAIVAMPDEV